MENLTKEAILFYGKSRAVITFDKYKQYEDGAGYVVLFDLGKEHCILCQFLDEREAAFYNDTVHRLVLKRGKEITETSVIIIEPQLRLDQVKSAINKLIYSYE